MKARHILTAALLLASASTQAQDKRPLPPPLVTDTPMVHDPVMAQEGGTYYLFSTGNHIQVMTSTDRRRWTLRRGGALGPIPAWTRDSVPGFRSHVWAPDVLRWHGRWWMAYSCSTFGKNTSAIGLARCASLSAFHWDDMGCLVSSRKDDNFNAIDPCFAVDDDDRVWLAFGSFWDGIQLVRLTTVSEDLRQYGSWMRGTDERLVVDSTFQRITLARRYHHNAPEGLQNPTSRYAGLNAIEAPFIFRHDGWYYLLVSWDYCCRGEKSNYRVVVGRSRHVSGPYLDREGRDMAQGGGTLVAQGDKRAFEAMGHCAVYTFGGDDVFVCHGYSVPLKGASILVQRRLRWDADGWFTLEQEDR